MVTIVIKYYLIYTYTTEIEQNNGLRFSKKMKK